MDALIKIPYNYKERSLNKNIERERRCGAREFILGGEVARGDQRKCAHENKKCARIDIKVFITHGEIYRLAR